MDGAHGGLLPCKVCYLHSPAETRDFSSFVSGLLLELIPLFYDSPHSLTVRYLISCVLITC